MTAPDELERAHDALERETLLETVETLSAGERAMRVALARALRRPEVAPKWSAILGAVLQLRADADLLLERIRRQP